MRTKLTIPKTISVGFQNRADTYTGKLAYIIYTDAKGVLRKESSWQNWRDKKIDPIQFDNVPTSGFVLNKKVGDYGGYNHRQAYVRVYDPRDFEFEITIPNLVFILEECSAIKGKGLEGDFVYSWDGTELVLLPVTSKDYKLSAEFTDLQTKKLTKADIKEGCVYLNKDQEQYMYLGRHDWYELTTSYNRDYHHLKYLKHSKQHVFVSVDGKSKYWTQTGFTKLAAKLGEDPSPLFADEYAKFKASDHGSEPIELVGKKCPTGTQIGSYRYDPFFIKKDKEYYPVWIQSDYRNGYHVQHGTAPVSLTNDKKVVIPDSGRNSYTYGYNRPSTSAQEIEKMELYNLFIQNKQGTLIQL